MASSLHERCALALGAYPARVQATTRYRQAMLRCVAWLFASGWLSMVLTLCACATTGQGSPLRVPDVRQTTDYTCSASALQAVLAYFGEEAGEPELASELGATPQDGAPPEAIVRVARAHGLSAELREDLRIADLASAVRRGIPVIVALQAWPDAPIRDYAQAWDDGHYVVVIAVERERLVFEDPSLLGSRGVLSHQEFERRWHDQDGSVRRQRMGIFVSGRAPSPPPLFRMIE
ncbi:MAG: C39 family peptidase [Myxococcales bacterium]|nr:C39 family peptidase [Myxococcales bacterium]